MALPRFKHLCSTAWTGSSPMNAPPPVGGRQRRRVAARPWGEEALSPRALGEEAISPRGRASHSVDGGSTRYVMTSFLLIPRCYSCRDLRRLAQIKRPVGHVDQTAGGEPPYFSANFIVATGQLPSLLSIEIRRPCSSSSQSLSTVPDFPLVRITALPTSSA